MLSGGVLCSCSNVTKQLPSTPNFLIIMTDQQRWDALAIAGNSAIITPNLDRLAAEGTRFSTAVSPCPVSGPARTSMLTGLLVENSTVRTNMDSDGLTTIPHLSYDQLLEAQGYVCEYYGKFHSPLHMADCYANPSEYGLEAPHVVKQWETLYKYYLTDKVKFDKRIPEAGELFDFSFYGGLLYRPNPMDRRYEDAFTGGAISPEELKKRMLSQPDHHGVLQLDDDLTITALQAQQTIDALKRNKDNRFSITCSFHSVHSPILPTQKYVDMYNVEEMPIPVSIDDSMTNSPYKGSNGRLIMPEYRDAKKVQYMTQHYYALVTEVDEWVGKILQTLDELELADNTVVIFTSDHGEMLGAHGMREKNVFLEESLRVPLIVRYPAEESVCKVVDNPISTLNIFATILDYANIDKPSDGYSLRPIMKGESLAKDAAISEWNWGHKNQPNLMIRTNQWKLIVSSNFTDHRIDALYNLKDDPFELNNLLAHEPSPEVKAITSTLITQLVNELEPHNHPTVDDLIIKSRKIVH